MLRIALLLAAVGQGSATPDTTGRPNNLPDLTVIGTTDRLRTIAGSGTLVGPRQLSASQPRHLTDAVRGVPGVVVRDEEGLGLRANIGIRGLNPTRSTTVLLLEDGVPFAIAPYGDNASYFVPPVRRFARLEVLKGGSQIMHGPRTVGGVINFQTPPVPDAGWAGRAAVRAGSFGHRELDIRLGSGTATAGVYGEVLGIRSRAARANVGTTILDGTLKGELALGPAHALSLKATAYHERSQATYSGLREAEYAANPFQNPFLNDSMFMDRLGIVAQHRALLGSTAHVTTRLYASWLGRDWWRQSSNSGERPNDASDTSCGGMANLTTTCGNQGRLRQYTVWGMEPRLFLGLEGLGAGSQLEAGVRVHFERQDRRQLNGATPNVRDLGTAANPNAGLVEDNLRENAALALFLQPRLQRGRWSVTPGLRIEHVRYQRTNRLDRPAAVGTTALTEVIPGLGATYNPTEAWTVFAGLHRGFAPPRTEDLLTAAGGVVDLDPERSWNTELGMRGRPWRGLEGEVTLFQLDFSNQIIPASVAGGSGATLTSAGHTLHRGLELGLRLEPVALPRGSLGLDLAWTWLPVARFEGTRHAWVGTAAPDVVGKVYTSQASSGTRTRVDLEGRRLPYAPTHTLTSGLGWSHHSLPSLRVEAVWSGRQFGDPVNTTVTVADGQQGVLPAALVWNLASDYLVAPLRTRIALSVRNLFDRRYLVDRTRGMLPGMPRTVQVGAEVAW